MKNKLDEDDPFNLGWKAQREGLSRDANPWLNSNSLDVNHWKDLEWDRGWKSANETEVYES